MAFIIDARVLAVSHESSVPTNPQERLAVESLLHDHALEQEVPLIAQTALLLPIVSLKDDRTSAIKDAKRIVSSRLAESFPVAFQDGSESAVIWVRTKTGHEIYSVAFNDLGEQRTIKIQSETGAGAKEYTGVIVFAFNAIGVDATA